MRPPSILYSASADWLLPRKRASHLEEKAIDLGRKLGRVGDMWYSFRTIFEHALDRQTTTEDIGYTEGYVRLLILHV